MTNESKLFMTMRVNDWMPLVGHYVKSLMRAIGTVFIMCISNASFSQSSNPLANAQSAAFIGFSPNASTFEIVAFVELLVMSLVYIKTKSLLTIIIFPLLLIGTSFILS